MNILLATATNFEIVPFLEQYRQSSIGSHCIDVLVTGIGLSTATYSLTKQIHLKKPDVIIQAGIGGCFDEKMKLGTVVIVKKDIIADLGVVEKKQFKTLFDLGFITPNQPPYSQQWLINNSALLKKSRLKKVNAISVNEITTSISRKKFYQKKYGAVIESMEGAALHYTALMENIPFLQLRAASNYIGERNKQKWNIKDSIINLNTELLRLLNNI